MIFQQSDDESHSSQSAERYLQFTPLRDVSPMNGDDGPRSARNYKSTTQTIEEDEEQQGPANNFVRNLNKPNISSILKLQSGRFSESKQIFREPIMNRLQSSQISGQSGGSPEKNSKFSLYPTQPQQPKPSNIVKQNIAKAGIKSEKKVVKKEVLNNSVIVKPTNEAQEAKFLVAVDRIYLHEKRRVDGLKKLQDEKEQNVGIGRPQINQTSQRILERKLKRNYEIVKSGENGEDEDLREFQQTYMMKDKQVQVDLIRGLPKIRQLFPTDKIERKIIHRLPEPPQKSPLQISYQMVHMESQTDEIVMQRKMTDMEAIKQIKQQEPEQQKGKKQNKQKKQQKVQVAQVHEQKKLEYYVPIYERYEYVIKKKEKWVAEQQSKQKEDFDRKELAEIKKGNSAPLTDDQVQEFVKTQLSWAESKNQEILRKRIDRDCQETQGLTFKPEIRSVLFQSEPVEERLQKYQIKKLENLVKLEAKYMPNFKPTINVSSSKLMNSSMKLYCSQINDSSSQSYRSKEY